MDITVEKDLLNNKNINRKCYLKRGEIYKLYYDTFKKI